MCTNFARLASASINVLGVGPWARYTHVEGTTSARLQGYNMVFRCFNPKCGFAVHTEPRFGAFCCLKCEWCFRKELSSTRHGEFCQQVPTSAQKSPWIAPEFCIEPGRKKVHHTQVGYKQDPAWEPLVQEEGFVAEEEEKEEVQEEPPESKSFWRWVRNPPSAGSSGSSAGSKRLRDGELKR